MNQDSKATLPQMTVDPSTLKVDHSYQRHLDSKRVDYIVDNFKPSLLRFPICSVRESGEIYIIEGQHTTAAVVKLGWRKLPIFFHKGLTVEQEAIEFDQLNRGGREGRLPVSVSGRFKARLCGGLPVEAAINDIVTKLGLNLHGTGKSGISAIEAVYWANANDNLEKTLYTLKSWCPESKSVYENSLIRAVSAFYSKYPIADPCRLVKSISQYLPDDVSRRFARAKRAYPRGSYEGQIIELRDIYNAKAKGNSRLA